MVAGVHGCPRRALQPMRAPGLSTFHTDWQQSGPHNWPHKCWASAIGAILISIITLTVHRRNYHNGARLTCLKRMNSVAWKWRGCVQSCFFPAWKGSEYPCSTEPLFTWALACVWYGRKKPGTAKNACSRVRIPGQLFGCLALSTEQSQIVPPFCCLHSCVAQSHSLAVARYVSSWGSLTPEAAKEAKSDGIWTPPAKLQVSW